MILKYSELQTIIPNMTSDTKNFKEVSIASIVAKANERLNNYKVDCITLDSLHNILMSAPFEDFYDSILPGITLDKYLIEYIKLNIISSEIKNKEHIKLSYGYNPNSNAYTPPHYIVAYNKAMEFQKEIDLWNKILKFDAHRQDRREVSIFAQDVVDGKLSSK